MTDPETTQELLRPEVEEECRLTRWQRLRGCCAHCFHENPRHHRPEAGVLVRICCKCGENQMSELLPAHHGRYMPDGTEVARIWSAWHYWLTPEQRQFGGMGY